MKDKLKKNEICFHGGTSFDAVGISFDKLNKKEKVIRADVTDAWFDTSPKVINLVNKNLPWLLKNSPPTLADGLIKAISTNRKIPEENILVGGGSSDLMFIFFPNFDFKRAVIIDPMYGESAHIIKNVLGKKIKRVFQNKENNFKVDIESVVKEVLNGDLVIIVNPNNPTGQFVRRTQMDELLKKLPKKVTLFIDETYIDFIGKEESVESLAIKNKNLVVLKSMSKFFALSGARIGYLIAHEEVTKKLRNKIPPWSVGLIGQVAGVKAMEDESFFIEKNNETSNLRKEFLENLTKIEGIKVFPSVTNFLLIDISHTGRKAKEICSFLEKRSIFIRNPQSQSVQFKEDFIRISVKDRKTNNKICNALKEAILAKEELIK